MSFQWIDASAPQLALSVEQAVAETLAYSDVFDFPLRVEELHRYLPIRMTLPDLQAALDLGNPAVASADGFYFLRGRESVVCTRRRREVISRPMFRKAMLFGRILGALPFIRMVALTGSLTMLNSEETGDLDYMLVTAPGRVWTARGFALLFGRLTVRMGFTLCPNLIVSDRALAWEQHDLYSAREICQMVPISGKGVYGRLRCINDWTERVLPNASGLPPLAAQDSSGGWFLQGAEEWPLLGFVGNRVEAWEMQRKVRRLSRQTGHGVETRFDADVCQGNFQHHGAETRQALVKKLAELGICSPLTEPPSKPE